MRIRSIVIVGLFAIGAGAPVWASSRDMPSPPVQLKETVQLDASPQKPIVPPAPTRGQLLYENHCTVCHASVVHLRSDRRAKSQAEIRTWVMHWSGYLKLRWQPDEVDDVVKHLNQTFYKFAPQ